MDSPAESQSQPGSPGFGCFGSKTPRKHFPRNSCFSTCHDSYDLVKLLSTVTGPKRKLGGARSGLPPQMHCLIGQVKRKRAKGRQGQKEGNRSKRRKKVKRKEIMAWSAALCFGFMEPQQALHVQKHAFMAHLFSGCMLSLASTQWL